MPISLNNSNNQDGYGINSLKAKFLVGTLIFSGTPYAGRHFDLRNENDGNNWYKHVALGLLELIPFIGGGVALLDYFINRAVPIKESSDITQNTSSKVDIVAGSVLNSDTLPTLSAEKEAQELAKMGKNFQKAISEHLAKDPQSTTLATQKEVETSLQNQDKTNPLILENPVVASQSKSRQDNATIEDANFHTPALSRGWLVGVLDGHGGPDVSKYVSQKFTDIFTKTLNNYPSIRSAFNDTLEKLHKQIQENPAFDKQGCTAVISLIDPSNHKVYTATLGDSEAFIYRKINGKFKCIPLSCVRDWLSPKDWTRRGNALLNDNPEKKIPEKPGIESDSKHTRYPTNGVNTARGLGDVLIEKYDQSVENLHEAEGEDRANLPKTMSIKPKITVTDVLEGDIILHVSDGITDYITQERIIEAINTWQEGDKSVSLPQTINNLLTGANKDYSIKDDITVIATIVS